MDIVFGLLKDAGLTGQPGWLLVALAAAIPAILLVTFMAVGPILYVYAETKLAGFFQDRIGPKRVGPHGILQTVADAVKLLFKEAIYPAGADKLLFILAPCLVVVGAFLPFVVVPFGNRLQAANLNVGLFYIVAVASLSTVGLIMAGWASNNKYALFGAMRSAAQIVSYEIPAVMILLVIVILVGSLSLQDITTAQMGGLQNWFLFRYFPLNVIAFLIFLTAGLAECNRAPFDIPEAESELVAGFHTEYSGFFFAMFFMAEYTEMVIISATATVLFLGGYLAPVEQFQDLRLLSRFWPGFANVGLGPLWLIAKAWTLVFVMMWLRWTLPRLRVDQLMHVAWKVLLPISLVLMVATGGLVLWKPTALGFPWDRYVGWPLVVAILAYLVVGILRAVRWSRRRPQELFTTKATLHYPEERWQLPPKSRMRLFMKYEDCIGCGQCARACPVQCIYIKADKRDPKSPAIFAANGQGIKLDVHVFDIDMSLCCYCNLCTYPCPTNCIYMTPEYEFASTDLTQHLYHFAKKNAKFITDDPKKKAAAAAAAAAPPAGAPPASAPPSTPPATPPPSTPPSTPPAPAAPAGA
jgi:NADH-quinone oxidoreductase subunit H